MQTTALFDLSDIASVSKKMEDVVGVDAGGAIMNSNSHLNAENIIPAILRVGWTGVGAAVREVIEAARLMSGDDGTPAAIAESAELLYPLDVDAALAAVAVADGAPSFITAECCESDETLTGRTVVAQVRCFTDSGRWEVADEFEMDDAPPSRAITEALQMCVPYAERRVISAEVPFELASAAMGPDRGGKAAAAALSLSLRTLIEANAELAGTAVEDLIPRALCGEMTAGIESGAADSLDGLLAAACDAAASKSFGSTGHAEPVVEGGLR